MTEDAYDIERQKAEIQELFERLQDVEPSAPEWLNAAYPGLHDLNLDLAVEKVAYEIWMLREVGQ